MVYIQLCGPASKRKAVFFRKEKKMQNVVKLKNMYFYEEKLWKMFIWVHFIFKTILDHLICISKRNPIFSSKSPKVFFMPSLWSFFFFLWFNKIGLASYLSCCFTVFWWETNILLDITNIREPELQGVACFWPLGAGAAWKKMLGAGVTWENKSKAARIE